MQWLKKDVLKKCVTYDGQKLCVTAVPSVTLNGKCLAGADPTCLVPINSYGEAALYTTFAGFAGYGAYKAAGKIREDNRKIGKKESKRLKVSQNEIIQQRREQDKLYKKEQSWPDYFRGDDPVPTEKRLEREKEDQQYELDRARFKQMEENPGYCPTSVSQVKRVCWDEKKDETNCSTNLLADGKPSYSSSKEFLREEVPYKYHQHSDEDSSSWLCCCHTSSR